MDQEERPDPADVVEGKSAGSGHSSDVGGAGQSVAEDYAHIPCSQWRQYPDILNSDWQVHAKAVFPRDEEDFSYTNVELEVEAAVPAEMSAKHSEMGVATWMLVEDML